MPDNLLVYFLRKKGFIHAQIAQRLRLSPQAVSGIICKFQSRRESADKIFEMDFLKLRNKLDEESLP